MARRDQSHERKLELLSQLTKDRRDITAKKQVLVQQIDESKAQLKDKINVPKLVSSKVKSSFASSPNKWFIGSAVGGLIISKLFFGSVGSIFKKPKQKKASHGLLYTFATMAARPMIKSFLIGKARDYVAHRFMGQQPHQQVTYRDEYNSDNRY